MRSWVAFVAVLAVGLLSAPPARSADEMTSPAAATGPAGPPSSQPEASGGADPTAPASGGPARPWFLTLEASHELFGAIAGGDPGRLQELRRLRQAGVVMLERDELGLLIALVELKGGRVAAARGEFARLTRAASPKVALAARRYEEVLAVHPEGKVERGSLADYATFQSACVRLAGERAARGDALLAEAAAAEPLRVEDWEQAWAKLAEAGRQYDSAGVLDETVPARRAGKRRSVEQELAEMGVWLLLIEADRQRAQLLNDLDGLRRGGTGRWGPPLGVKQVNDRIDALVQTRDRFVGLVEVLARPAGPGEEVDGKPAEGGSGRPPPATGRPAGRAIGGAASEPEPLDLADLRRRTGEMDCLWLPRTAEGDRRFEALGQLFKEVKVRVPPGGKEADYRLLRLEKILR